MKLAMYQMRNAGSIEANLKKSLQAIEEAAHKGADMILFPEVQLTEFFPQHPGQDVKSYGMEIDSNIIKSFQEACRVNSIMAVPNVYLIEDGEYYDASIIINKNGEIIGIQKMVHVAYAEQFYESDYYTPADDGFKVFETEFGNIGIIVCFDRHYPEGIRTETLMGADLILVPTVNTKAEPMDMFEKEIQVQAFQNSVAVAMCNRVGAEDEMEFAGESIVVSPLGITQVKADDSENIIYADIDMEESKRVRESKPYLSCRRPELYL